MHLRMVDGIRNMCDSINLRVEEKEAKQVHEKKIKEMNTKVAELKELVKYPDETISWLRFCDTQKVPDARLSMEEIVGKDYKDYTAEDFRKMRDMCRESVFGSEAAIAAFAAYLGKLREGFISWPKESRLAQSAVHKFLGISVFPEYDDFTDEEIPDITEFSEYGNRWGIYIDDYVLNKAYDIVQQGTASKKFVSNIKNGVFMIVDSKLIEQQQADTTSVDL